MPPPLLASLPPLMDAHTTALACLHALAFPPCLDSLRFTRFATYTCVCIGNKLEHLDHIRQLQQCQSLVTLDLSSNKIRDDDAVELVMSLPLSLLKLNGNPVVSSMR